MIEYDDDILCEKNVRRAGETCPPFIILLCRYRLTNTAVAVHSDTGTQYRERVG